MFGTPRAARFAACLVAVICAVGSAAGQSTLPAPRPVPGSPTPTETLLLPPGPQVAVYPGSSGPLPPGLSLPGSNLPVLDVDAWRPVNPAVASALPPGPDGVPLPGSFAEELQQAAAGREMFRFCDWRNTYTLFPSSLLWEPPLASKGEPRFQALATNLSSPLGNDPYDLTAGNTLGIVRIEPTGSDLAVQLDVFGVAGGRFTQPDGLIVSDYRFGVPVTFRRGDWHAKVAYERTVGYLGDQFLPPVDNGPDYLKDEVVLGIDRVFEEQLRIYGQAGWAFHQQIPFGDPTPSRYQFGLEWFRRCATGWRGQPFLALNIGYRGETSFAAEYTAQAGWQWRDPSRRLAQCRVFVEYFDGYAPFSALYWERNKYTAIAVAVDY